MTSVSSTMVALAFAAFAVFLAGPVQAQDATPLPIATPAACAGGENLLPNGGFEAGTDGWYVNENVEAVTTQPHTGAMAVRLTAGNDNAYLDHGVSPVEPGATYTLSAWGRLSTSGELGEIGVQFYDRDGERLMHEEPPPLTFSGTTYEQRQLTFSLPAQGAKIYVFLNKVEGAADFSADALSLTRCAADAQAADVTASASGPAVDRSGCDPAYPEERTCIPPGPPFDQGCAITTERNFVVLSPDPQGLDPDQDGIGCVPIT